MVSTGLLILTSPPRVLATKLKHYLTAAKQQVQRTLYIKLEPGQNKLWPLSRRQPTPSELGLVSRLIPQIYNQAAIACSELDVRVLQSSTKLWDCTDHHVRGPFDVVLSETATENLSQYLKHQFNSECSNIQFVGDGHHSEHVTDGEITPPVVWENVVLGGTFDRLHNGHKVLLSEATLRCSKQLTIGVTDVPMIQNKILWELIESLPLRIQKLKEYIQDVDPTVTYKVVPIYDPFGPAIEDPDLNCIVVSEETLKGGKLVNEKRLQKGMTPLEVCTITLVEDPDHDEQEEVKISSSSQRMRLLGLQLRQSSPRPNIPPRPYLIGLTGGIASGKSGIGKHLEKLGAGVIDCDLLAHRSYAPGSVLCQKLKAEFGEDILTKEGAVDRKALGAKVFGDEARRQKLNSLVWPEVRRLADSQVQEHFMNGRSVVVLEAALLLEAEWKRQLHQIWVSFIPEKEAIGRVQERDGSSAEDALRRIRSQMSNSERIAQANVVFSSLWDKSYTQKQVERAWNNLQKILSADSSV